MNGNRIFVFDSDFFIRYRDYLWNVKAFHPVQRQFEMLLKNCYGHVIHEALSEVKHREFIN